MDRFFLIISEYGEPEPNPEQLAEFFAELNKERNLMRLHQVDYLERCLQTPMPNKDNEV